MWCVVVEQNLLFADMVHVQRNRSPTTECQSSTYRIYSRIAELIKRKPFSLDNRYYGICRSFNDHLRLLSTLLVLSIWWAICPHPNCSIPLVPIQNQILWPRNSPRSAHFGRPNLDAPLFSLPNIPCLNKYHCKVQGKLNHVIDELKLMGQQIFIVTHYAKLIWSFLVMCCRPRDRK